MKRHVVFAAIVMSLAVVVAAIELMLSRAHVKTYGPHAATPFGSIVFSGVALIAVALMLVVFVVVQERRRLARPRSQRRRRARRRSSDVARLLPAVTTRPPVAAHAVSRSVVAPLTVTPPAVVAVSAPAIAEAAAAPPAIEPPAVIEEHPAPAALQELVTIVDAAAVAPADRPADLLRHWGLREPAFDNAPSPRFLYPSPAHAEPLFRLRYAIRHRKGGAILTGTYGCGKTTLARAPARELEPSRFDVVLVANPLLTPIALLQEVLSQLGVTSPPCERVALLHALEARLVENLQRGRDTVVVVDEAQLITDDAVLNELRLLLNDQTNDRFLLTLVLAGSDELWETLHRHPHFTQRCALRARLTPLDREQTGHSVRHRLVTAGREAETLTEGAIDELYSATGGTPRVINAVCDLTLIVGAASGAPQVDRDLVRRVAGDVVPAHAA